MKLTRTSKAPRMRRTSAAGVTLIELMVAITLVAILTIAVTRAFIGGIDMERAYARRDQQAVLFDQVEEHIKQEIQSTFLDEVTTDTTTYFVGADGNNGTSSGNGTVSTTTTPGSTNSSSSSGSTASSSALGCDRLTFTTTFPGVPVASQTSTDDYETQQQNNGPVGGTVEVSLSTTPVGSPTGDNASGLFERIQRPSDADATQGGTESLLTPEVDSIGFQFWDGAEWLTSWDTTSTTTGQLNRLPAAVLVSYILKSDPTKTARSFVVALPQSDVTTLNPVTSTAAPGLGN